MSFKNNKTLLDEYKREHKCSACGHPYNIIFTCPYKPNYLIRLTTDELQKILTEGIVILCPDCSRKLYSRNFIAFMYIVDQRKLLSPEQLSDKLQRFLNRKYNDYSYEV